MADLSATSTSLRPPSLDSLLKPEGRHSSASGEYSAPFAAESSILEGEDDYIDISPVMSSPISRYGNEYSYRREDQDRNNEQEEFIGNTSEFETTANTQDEYSEYNDPILSLISSDKMSPQSLALVLRTLPLSDKPLIKYINKAFKVHEDLRSLIDTISAGWEFIALQREIQRIISDANENAEENDDVNSRTFHDHIAKTVAQKALEFHQNLYELNASIIDINQLLSTFTPMQYVSDSGVVLTNISLKIIELKNSLSEKINVNYSQAKLIIMGSDLEALLRDFNAENRKEGNDAASSIIDADHPMISNDLAATIEGYKEFVVTILNQLNDAQELEDSAEVNECLAVIGDLEKMFDALMKQVYDPEYKSTNASNPVAKTTDSSPASSDVEYQDSEDETSQYFPNPHNKKESSHPVADFSSPTNSANFDNDTLYESDRDPETPARRFKGAHTKGHSKGQSSLSSSTTFGMTTSASKDMINFSHHNNQGKTSLMDEMPYLLQAFDNAKEAENELRESLKHSNGSKKKYSLSRINSRADKSPTNTKFPEEDEEQEHADENAYYGSSSMSSSIHFPKRGLASENSNLYSSSSFIRPPLHFKSSNPINASNPLIIKNPNVNSEENSLGSSLFSLFSKKGASESTLSASVPALPAPSDTFSKSTPLGLMSNSMVLRRPAGPLIRESSYDIDDSVD